MSYKRIIAIKDKSIHIIIIAVISLIINATILAPQVQGSLFLKNKDENISDKISSYIYSFFEENFDNQIKSEIVIQKFIGLLNILIILPIILLKGLITGAISLISGLIRTVLAIIKLTILSVAGIQGVLTITGLFVIFLGLMTKLGFKIFSLFSSPILSAIVLRLIPALGSLMGGLSLIVHSIVGLAIMGALPVLLVILILNIVKIFQNLIEDGNPTS